MHYKTKKLAEALVDAINIGNKKLIQNLLENIKPCHDPCSVLSILPLIWPRADSSGWNSPAGRELEDLRTEAIAVIMSILANSKCEELPRIGFIMQCDAWGNILVFGAHCGWVPIAPPAPNKVEEGKAKSYSSWHTFVSQKRLYA